VPDPFPPLMPVRVRGKGASEQGPRRKRNEDAFGFFEDATSAIAIVADGMGATGKHVADHTVETCSSIFAGRGASVLDDLAEVWWRGEHGETQRGGPRVRPFSTLPIAERVELRERVRLLLEQRVPEALGDIAVLEAEKKSLLGIPERVLHRVNGDLYRFVEADRVRRSGLGAAAACVLFGAGHAAIAHVGDCRVSHVRGSSIERLTLDHTFQNELERLSAEERPDLTPEELERVPDDVLTRLLGMRDKVDVDVRVVPIEKGDLFLLATDGFWRGFSEMELLTALTARKTEAAAYLIDRARRGATGHSGDNLTAMVVEVLEV
jgi:serine/threonine protein phosphatase PrpC